jgi:hypothetical protein
MWKFRGMAKGEDSVDPIQGEFFASEEIGDLSEILIRESIQNSLDARVDKNGVAAEVAISYRMSDYSFSDLQAEGMPLSGLAPHISAENSGLNAGSIPKPDDKVDYLVVEDFGTRGLNGDPDFDDSDRPVVLDDRGYYDFFFFWRNIGRSGKKEGIGSWGLGKHVFPAASRINAYFGLTCRAEDNKRLLMGKSILKIHHHESRKYAPYGYFGRFEEQNFFALPFDQDHQISSFREIFQIRRDTEPGLSVVVPFPRTGLLDPKPLVESVLRDYFYPVIRGRLKVSVSYEGCPAIMIDDTTIKAVAREYLASDEMLLKTIDLAIWSAGLPEEEVIVLNSPCLNRVPSVADIEISEELLGTIRESLQEKGKVALRVPVRVKLDGAEPERGEFDICFTQTDIARCVPAKYIRQGIDVKNANRAKLDAGCIALVEVHDHVLGWLLRISEPPAHDRWEQRNNEDLLARYDRGSKTIGFVKSAPYEIWRRISKKNVEQNRDLLRDIFHLDVSDIPSGKKQQSGSDKKKKEPEEVVDPPESSVRMVRTEKITGKVSGFVVSTAENATHTPDSITVKAAYRVSAGNHFSKYSPLDFRLNRTPIKIKMAGVKKISCEDNQLVLKVVKKKFSIEVTGFDPNRDLVVDVKPAREEAGDDQEV